jgi:hypothetical protein
MLETPLVLRSLAVMMVTFAPAHQKVCPPRTILTARSTFLSSARVEMRMSYSADRRIRPRVSRQGTV